jgi:hypothetical protein
METSLNVVETTRISCIVVTICLHRLLKLFLTTMMLLSSEPCVGLEAAPCREGYKGIYSP